MSDNFNLNIEFNKLINEVYSKIDASKNEQNNELNYSFDQANQLIRLIEDRTGVYRETSSDDYWQASSSCYEDENWQSSRPCY